MLDVLRWLWDRCVGRDLGDIASIIGVFVALLGFGVTISFAWKARQAALETQERFCKFDALSDCSTAISVMEEIKRLHRSGSWSVLPDRYAAVRKMLISIRGNHKHLSNNEQGVLQGATQHFADMEAQVERALVSNKAPPNIARLNKIVSGQVDRVVPILNGLRREIAEGKPHGAI